jgi:hypothetical protein
MKVLSLVLIFAGALDPSVFAASVQEATNSQFMSAVQFATQESSAELMERSYRLLKEQFAQSVEVWPELQARPYQVRTFGNEVVFYFVTDTDMRVPMQRAVTALIQNLNGRVSMRGRSSFYRTTLPQASGGYLETAVNDNHTKILSITAQGVPLRDLLKQLKTQLGSLSYLVPGECADRRVDWSFGGAGSGEPKSVAGVMSELATLFNLKFENKKGTHIFSGTCEAPRIPTRMNSAEILTARLIPTPSTRPPTAAQNVYFPLMRLGD